MKNNDNPLSEAIYGAGLTMYPLGICFLMTFIFQMHIALGFVLSLFIISFFWRGWRSSLSINKKDEQKELQTKFYIFSVLNLSLASAAIWFRVIIGGSNNGFIRTLFVILLISLYILAVQAFRDFLETSSE